MVSIAYVVDSNLSHSGILGMKWGRRNGPPYPLKPGDHSAAEVRANPRLASVSGSDNPNTSASASQTNIRRFRNPKKYTFEELKKMNERAKMEEEYRQRNGLLTKQQKGEIVNLVAKNLAGVLTNELPKGVIDVGKEVVKLNMTFWNKIWLSVANSIGPEITKSVNSIIAESREARTKMKTKMVEERMAADKAWDEATKDKRHRRSDKWESAKHTRRYIRNKNKT